MNALMADFDKRKRMQRGTTRGNVSQAPDSGSCEHAEVMKDLCVTCGLDLRHLDDDRRSAILNSASISMIHSVPELKISAKSAEELGKADEESLLKDRKLVLLVDLDQTIIHTTNENVRPDLKDVHHFWLAGPNSPCYHTKLRPHTLEFLRSISKTYELHICTFGVRLYAHQIAAIIDPDQKLFSHRILSRDECLDPSSKTGNLSALFPCGDSMVCIIDDREDVWNFSPNVVSVKPYLYFKNTGDINSPYKQLQEEKCYRKNESETLPAKSVSSSEEAVAEDSQDSLDSQGKGPSEPTTGPSEPATGPSEPATGPSEPATGPSEPATPASSPASSDISEVAAKDAASGSKIETLSDSSNEGSVKEVPEEKRGDGTEAKSSQELDDDDFLLYLEEILQRIHGEFFKEFDEKQKYRSENEPTIIPDLKEIIPRVKKQTLAGVNIVFSGVIPTNMPFEKSKMFLMAKSLGANVTRGLISQQDGSPLERTTHVVAAKFGTEKVSKALKNPKIKIVNPFWLESCAERWERVEEMLFLLKKDDNFQVEKLSSSQHLSQKDSKRFLEDQRSLVGVPKAPAAQPPIDTPIYDPVTGKRIRPKETDEPKAGSSKSCENTPSTPILMDDKLTTLSMFSTTELSRMSKEVEDACSEGDDLDSSSSDGEEAKPSKKRPYEESSEDSMDAECPKGWCMGEKKVRYDKPRDDLAEESSSNPEVNLSSDSSDDNNSEGSLSDDVAADLLEREFMGE